MWAKDLFKCFRENNIDKEKELAKHVSKTSLESIKRIYKKRRKQGMTPFIVSILHNDIALCEQLIKEGIHFGQQYYLHFFGGQKFNKFNDDAAKLITLGPNSNVFTDFNKTTPMFWAIKCTKLSLIDKLISSGHNINGAVERFAGTPALLFAVLNKNIDVVKHLLLNQSCDIHKNHLFLKKPFDLAISLGCQHLVKLMLKHGESVNCTDHPFSPLVHAILLKDFSMVKFILSEGANINVIEKGITPLILAISLGQFEIATFLIAKGGKVDYKDNAGNTALHKLLPHLNVQGENSIDRPAFKLAQLLVEKGVPVDVVNENDVCPLIDAITRQDPLLVDLFLSAPVDVNQLFNIYGKYTCLQYAVSPKVMPFTKSLVDKTRKRYEEKQYSIAQSLIKKGADVNKPSWDGRTALHIAAESGFVRLIELLLESNVDISKPSEDGKVALHYAACNGSGGVLKLLLESGAEVNVQDNIGLTPLDFAICAYDSFSCDTAKLLIEYGANIYNHYRFNSFNTYDLAVAAMRPDLMKVFWREGYPYDFKLSSTKDVHVANKLRSQRNKLNNGVSPNVNKRLLNAKRKEMKDLINAQSNFFTGVEKNSVKMVLNALQKGAEVGGSCLKVPSPLHFLAKQGFTDVAQVLLSKGVKPNTVDSEGNIPVDLAVQFGHFKMYMTLLQYGACYKRTGFDTSLFQKEGNSKMNEMYVLVKKAFKDVKRGNHRILKSVNKYMTLKEWDVYRALVNCVDEKGRTLMQVAMDRGHKDIVQKLMEYRLQAPETDDLQ